MVAGAHGNGAGNASLRCLELWMRTHVAIDVYCFRNFSLPIGWRVFGLRSPRSPQFYPRTASRLFGQIGILWSSGRGANGAEDLCPQRLDALDATGLGGRRVDVQPSPAGLKLSTCRE